MTYLSLIVLLPLAALAWVTAKGGWDSFKTAVTAPDAVAAIKLTLVVSLLVVLINGVFGTLVAWVMVRDEFRGKAFLNSLIDLPFALPTIVAGLTLLTLYGPNSPIGINVAYTRTAVLLALLFETLPFVIRSVQPVLLEMDREVEDAAGSLGANRFTVFRRVILPTILPAIVSGAALAFARAIGEFGSVVLMSGNIPFSTEVASVHIFAQVQSDNPDGAAALAVLMLGLALGILLAMGALERWGSRHDR
jgi:sulfate/thiosulfate transport system permease protein